MLSSFAEVELQDEVQGRCNDGEYNRKASETPSPVDVIVEVVRRFWPGECGDHIRRRGESIRQATVLQLGCISGDYIDTISHSSESEIVKHLKCFLNVSGYASSGGEVEKGGQTYAAQKVGRLWQTAMRMSPNVARQVMMRNPSALPQTSIIFDKGMKQAADMASATM